MDIQLAYQKSMERYQTKYVSSHWKRWNDGKHDSKLIDFANLGNFRSNKLSWALDDGVGEVDQSIIQRRLSDALVECGLTNPKELLRYFHSTNIGTVERYIKIDDKYTDYGEINHIVWLHILKSALYSEIDKIKTICEFGGGYGSFAHKICIDIKCKYISIDLPEANFLSSYYLRKCFPEKRFLLYDDVENDTIDNEQIEEVDIVIVPPWCRFINVSFDLFVNTRSMQEMKAATIKHYFDLIHSGIIEGGYLFNLNRYWKASPSGYSVYLHKHPYDDDWKVVLSQPAWKQSGPEDLSQGHRLLITKRQKHGDIRQELKRLKRIAKEHVPGKMWRRDRVRSAISWAEQFLIGRVLLSCIVYLGLYRLIQRWLR